METIRGKASLDLDLHGFMDRLTNYKRVFLDLGTGDGRYVRYLADRNPDSFIIGVDSCRENLQEHSRAKLQNMLFIIASAQELPHELYGLVSRVTINFPWGSLLGSLLNNDPLLLNGLSSIARPNAQLEIHLNGGALAEAGTSLEAGAEAIHDNIHQYGWKLSSPCVLDTQALKGFPSTWAKRLAFGRDPRSVQLKGVLNGIKT
jgi:hypothetical protein